MSKPVEFGEFYKLLEAVKLGNAEKNKELEWMLAEYEHAKDAQSSFDELGQIFCHHGVMELYEYTGLENFGLISSLEKTVWEYLETRMGISLPNYMVRSMIEHANNHKLAAKISTKWETSLQDLELNIEDLAKYVTEGIIDVIK